MKEKKTGIPYHNRELNWLDFNFRVLDEAFRESTPIMERLKFLSITSSNLDEFFMIRVYAIIEQVQSNYNVADYSGLTPKQQLSQLNKKVQGFISKQYNCWQEQLLPNLKSRNIRFLEMSELNKKQQEYISEYFEKVVFPVLTPMAIDKNRKLPFLANKTLNLAVRLTRNKQSSYAVVQIPSVLPRFIELPNEEGTDYVLLENIITEKLYQLFDLHEIKATGLFRITRNLDFDIDDESEDFLEEVQKFIKKRKKGSPVRIEISEDCDEKIKQMLVTTLKAAKHDIYEIKGPIDFTFLAKLAGQSEFKKLCFKDIDEVLPEQKLSKAEGIFASIREKDILLHHPYDSFENILMLLREAAQDEKVLAIKQTLYRVGKDSPVVEELIRAAKNGKQVTVMVELRARFDEENNLIWAKRLEHAGCHVIYGLVGYKTHCKILLIIRSEAEGIKRYVHMGTGNYNHVTSRLYTDIGLLTSREEFGLDASQLFNGLTGYANAQEYRKMIISPVGMRKFIAKMIESEIKNAQKGLKSGITIKVNSLVDYDTITQLYKASQAGVEVKLIVRGICCLVPGVEGISDNISVKSIVGRFLEHSRIYKFESGGEKKIYLGSADLMPRNLDRRVELIFPIEDKDIKQTITNMIEIMLKDTVNSHIKMSDNTYKRVDISSASESIDSQSYGIQVSRIVCGTPSSFLDS